MIGCCQARKDREATSGEDLLFFCYKSQESKAFTRVGLPPCVAEAFVPEHFQDSGGDVPNSGAFAGLCESSGAASMSSMIEQRRGLEVPDSQRRPKTFAAANSSIVDDTKPRDLFDLKKQRQLLEVRLQEKEACLLHQMQEFRRRKQQLSNYIETSRSQRGDSAKENGEGHTDPIVDALKSQLSELARDLMQSTSQRDSVKEENEEIKRSIMMRSTNQHIERDDPAEESRKPSISAFSYASNRNQASRLDGGGEKMREATERAAQAWDGKIPVDRRGDGQHWERRGEIDDSLTDFRPAHGGKSPRELSPYFYVDGPQNSSHPQISFHLLPNRLATPTLGGGLSPNGVGSNTSKFKGVQEVRRISSDGLLLRNYPNH